MVKLLLYYGADVHIRTRFDGATPLLSSLTNRPANAEVVKLLLDHGADVNARMSPSIAEYQQFDGDTALHRAVVHREVKIAEILLSRGADVNAKTIKGMTPLGLARYWEKRSGNRENQSATKEYRDIFESLRKHGGHE